MNICWSPAKAESQKIFGSYSGLTKNLALKLKFQSKLIAYFKIMFLSENILGMCYFYKY